MIDEKVYREVLDNGLCLDHYFILCSMKNGVKLMENKRIQGFVNLLAKKGYIENDELTEKGLDLVDSCEDMKTNPVVEETKDEDIEAWISNLYTACQNKVYELTGKRQIRGEINKKYFSFIPNIRDFKKNILKVITIYKLKDLNKIEDTILKYITECAESKNWFPILYYYLIKEGKSQMVTDLDNIDEKEDASGYTKHKLL